LRAVVRPPIALLVNPSAGGGRAARLLPQVQRVLRDAGLLVRTERTSSLGHARALAGVAARAGDVVATLGGDGLAACAAGVLREVPGAVLGVLPGGRGNDLARVLGIPRDAREAAALLATGVERDLDVGEVDGRSFVGVASLGFDSDANRIANADPSLLGRGVYAYGALGALSRWRPAGFELELDGQAHAFRGYSVAAANTPAYGGGMLIAPDARLDDGLLDVVLTGEMSRLRALVSLPSVFTGAHVRRPEVSVHQAREIRVTSDRPFTVYADGDPIGRTPVTIRAVPRALRVIVPAGSRA
jgi:YegS/Rv2252/BmrU family lipid kinase